MARASLGLIPLLITGCDAAANTFEVEASGALAAQLQLCGKSRSLQQTGSKLYGAWPASCEGSGVITVSFADRPAVNCRIGYVTPGMAQQFRFTVEGGQCRAVLDRR